MTDALRWIMVVLLTGHGLIHFLGVAKGFGWSVVVDQFRRPIGPGAAVLWFLAGALVLTAAALLATGAPSWWWTVAVAAAVASQLAIATWWSDASAGTVINLFLVLAAAHAFASVGHNSYNSQWNDHAKLLSVAPVVDASGPEMDRAETVTVFNDLVVLAPGAIVDAPVRWTAVDSNHVQGVYTTGDQSVTAVLTFNTQHAIVNFVSQDRFRASADGKSFERMGSSTPLTAHGDAGGHHLATIGEGRWHAPQPDGNFTYLEFRLDNIEYNVESAD